MKLDLIVEEIMLETFGFGVTVAQMKNLYSILIHRDNKSKAMLLVLCYFYLCKLVECFLYLYQSTYFENL